MGRCLNNLEYIWKNSNYHGTLQLGFMHFNETGYCNMDYKPSNKFWTNNIIYSFHLNQLKCELINENPENYSWPRPRHNN